MLDTSRYIFCPVYHVALPFPHWKNFKACHFPPCLTLCFFVFFHIDKAIEILHCDWQDIEISGWCYSFTATSMCHQWIACINCCSFWYDWMKVLISKTKLLLGTNSLLWSYPNCCWDFIWTVKISSTRTIAKSRYGWE